MVDFLYQLIGDFESIYLVQICRYRRRTRIEPDRPGNLDPQMSVFQTNEFGTVEIWREAGERDAGANLTRFHGVFAPNSHYRVLVTPAGRGKGKKATTPEQSKSPAEHRVAMTWAKRLRRVFKIDIDTCSECAGSVTGIACIEDPLAIKKILLHLDQIAGLQTVTHLPESRAAPQLV